MWIVRLEATPGRQSTILLKTLPCAEVAWLLCGSRTEAGQRRFEIIDVDRDMAVAGAEVGGILDSRRMLVVLIGVSGVGKTVVGRLVAETLGLPFHDGDDFHPESNRRKMAAGTPLTEADREPWLRDLALRMAGWEEEGGALVACSALRARHREVLAGAAPGAVRFVFLDAPEEVIRERLDARRGHYMPPGLLDSQLATLERPGPGEAVRIDASETPEETARAVVVAIERQGPD